MKIGEPKDPFYLSLRCIQLFTVQRYPLQPNVFLLFSSYDSNILVIPMWKAANHQPPFLSVVSRTLPIGTWSTSQKHAKKPFSTETPTSASCPMSCFRTFHRIPSRSFPPFFLSHSFQLSSLSPSEAFQTSVARCFAAKTAPKTAVIPLEIDETRVVEGVLSVRIVETVERRWRRTVSTRR